VRALIGSVIATFHDIQAQLEESEARPLKIKLFTFLMGKIKFAKKSQKILGLIPVFNSLFCNIEDLYKTIINRFHSWAWYKPTGSSNFSSRDPWVNVLTVELHQRARRTISVRPQCLTLYDNSGQPVAKFGFHSDKPECWAR